RGDGGGAGVPGGRHPGPAGHVRADRPRVGCSGLRPQDRRYRRGPGRPGRPPAGRLRPGPPDGRGERRPGGRSARGPVRGPALGGPVDPQRRCIVQASRMAGWNDVPVGDLLEERFGVPAVVENDADALALGEHHARSEDGFDSVTVKAGTAIGSGLIVDGKIYHGWSAGAGNITHTRVDAPSTAPCSCGNFGCLETVASGAGILRLLQERGVEAESTADVVRLAAHGDPEAMTLVRAAGGYLG